MHIEIVQNIPAPQETEDFFYYYEDGIYRVSRYAVDPYLSVEEKQKEMERLEKEYNERKNKEKQTDQNLTSS